MYTTRAILVAFFIAILGRVADAALLSRPAVAWDPKTTYAVIVGVLNWQDSRYHPYSTHHRKDEELYRVLLDRGVPEANTQLLLDKNATLNNMRQAIADVADKAPANSTFIFYYAGHGYKSVSNHTYLANYDVNYSDPEKTGFDMMEINDLLSTHFKGNQVLLMSDSCYSGALRYVAEALEKSGKMSASITSADEVDTSTNNWTFTQTIIDSLRGKRLADRDHNGQVTLKELAEEVKDAMVYREDQRAGVYIKNWPKGMEMAKAQGGAMPHLDRESMFKEGQYVLLPNGDGSSVGRVVGVNEGVYRLQFYDYADSSVMTASEAQCRPLSYDTYPRGSWVMVDWKDSLYVARVQRVEDNFMYVTYPGWPPYTSEWVTSRRIQGKVAEARQTNTGSLLIEWQGRWFPGSIVRQNGDRYYIHYAGYDDTWNEWVGPERIRRVQ